MAMHELSVSTAPRIAGAVSVLAVAVIAGALAFEHIGGYVPCPLCLEQRYAYYVSIPLLLLASALLARDYRDLTAVLFAIVGVIFFANAVFAGYHAGAEWKLWAGPDTCGADAQLTSGGGGLLKELENTRVVRCDEAQLRIFGLSLAGWNVIACLILAAGSGAAALGARRRPSQG
jgi:disulfide bond formation protein DsbB